MVCGDTQQAAEGCSSLIIAVLLDEESRRLGKEKHANGEDTCPDELDAGGNAIRAVVVTVLGALVDTGRKKNTNCLRNNFCLVMVNEIAVEGRTIAN